MTSAAIATLPAPGIAATAVTGRIWGLRARDLHDAWWSAQGVQCVRLGERAILQRAADLYLLIEPDQLVLLDLAGLSDRLTWHDAAVTRIRVVDEEASAYSERVVRDAEGRVERIERRYRPAVHRSGRVILTARPRVAEPWMARSDRRAGWSAVRRAVPRSSVDHWRARGRVLQAGVPDQERRLVAALVERWTDPDRAIEGIEERPAGVWHVRGERLDPDLLRVGPLWLGRARSADPRPCLVGPDWLPDVADPESIPPGFTAEPCPVFLREIADVAPPAGRRRRPAPGRGWYPYLKRALDLAVASVALAALAPLLGVIAALIVLEDGRPVFFGHRRQARGGRTFRCWKFRTMHRDAERLAQELEAYNVCDGPQVYIRDDPRVTRLGGILRRSHLDELPQFWNVLRGHMSLVGPRPSPDDENQFCPAWRDSRLSVRPGITGLWQLNRTREPGQDFQEWIRWDIEYVERASLGLDLRILVRTALMVILGRPDRGEE